MVCLFPSNWTFIFSNYCSRSFAAAAAAIVSASASTALQYGEKIHFVSIHYHMQASISIIQTVAYDSRDYFGEFFFSSLVHCTVYFSLSFFLILSSCVWLCQNRLRLICWYMLHKLQNLQSEQWHRNIHWINYDFFDAYCQYDARHTTASTNRTTNLSTNCLSD